jgi:hypothetical protein
MRVTSYRSNTVSALTREIPSTKHWATKSLSKGSPHPWYSLKSSKGASKSGAMYKTDPFMVPSWR